MDASPHLGLVPRSRIAIRLFCGEAIELSSWDAGPPAELHAVQQLRDTLRNHTAVHAAAARRLDHALDHAVHALHATLGTLELAPGLRTDLHARLAHARKRVDCERCAEPAPPCRDRADDDENVARRGECLRPFRDLFDFAAGVARRAYATRSLAGDRAQGVVLRFGTRPAERPHDAPIAIHVGGTTCYADREGTPVSDVSLCFAVARFDWPSYLASCYVLFHECFVHAFAEIAAPGPARTASLDETDLFSEGWMDWIALRAMTRVLEAANDAVPYPDKFVRAGEALHLARSDPYQSFSDGAATPASRLAPFRYQGYRAADELERWLRGRGKRVRPPGSSAWDALLQLSLDLNVTAFPGAARQRTRFAQLTLHALRSGGAQEVAFGELLRAYFRVREPRALLEQAETLRQRLAAHS